jgi:hypothetical protein
VRADATLPDRTGHAGNLAGIDARRIRAGPVRQELPACLHRHLGVEGERLPTEPAVNQVQLTRRARAEEPSNEQETAEEMERIVQAVLLCCVPAVSPRQSRYLARIFRGNAVTV